MKQETDEARGNVEKRIEYIKAEIKRVESSIGETSREAERVRGEVSTRGRCMLAVKRRC